LPRRSFGRSSSISRSPAACSRRSRAVSVGSSYRSRSRAAFYGAVDQTSRRPPPPRAEAADVSGSVRDVRRLHRPYLHVRSRPTPAPLQERIDPLEHLDVVNPIGLLQRLAHIEIRLVHDVLPHVPLRLLDLLVLDLEHRP